MRRIKCDLRGPVSGDDSASPGSPLAVEAWVYAPVVGNAADITGFLLCNCRFRVLKKQTLCWLEHPEHGVKINYDRALYASRASKSDSKCRRGIR